MDLHVIAITFYLFVSQVSTKLITGNYTIYNKEIISVQGATIRFSCPVNCTTNHLPVWSLHGYVLSDGLNINPAVLQKKRLRVKQNCGEQINDLLISNITKGDEGTYCCEDKLIHHCTILEISELIIQTDENNTLNGVTGENISFACFLTKDMPGVHLKAIYNHSVVASAAYPQLNVIVNATRQFHGEQFRCTAVFDDWNISLETSVMLNISYQPTIKIKAFPSTNFTAGDNASLFCSYDSNPNPVSITWKKNGSVVFTGDKFFITNIARSDAGQYQCIVDNGIFSGEDSIRIFVLYKLIVNIIPSPDKTVTEGNKLTMVCTHDSSLQTSITWIRHGVSVSTNQVLVIPEVSTNDSGLYQCIVKTSLGYGADAISILVLYRNREESNGDIPASDNYKKEMVYYMVAASVFLVLVLFITWKAYKHCKSREHEIERTSEIVMQENTNRETNENVQIANRSNMQPEDDRSSSNYETINENEMVTLPGSSNLVVVAGDAEDGMSENEKGENEIYSTSPSSGSEYMTDAEIARHGHEIVETSTDERLPDNTGLRSMTNDNRNQYIPLIRNEMEYLNSYCALRREHN